MNGAAPVVYLLRWGCPANVPWFVVPVIVDAIYRVLFAGSAADISQKCRIAIPPFLVHANPAPAPYLIALKVLVVAALLDVTPGSIFLRAVVAALSMGLAPKASATLRDAATKCTSKYERFIAALTATEPPQEYSTVRSLSQHGKHPELLTGQILLSHC